MPERQRTGWCLRRCRRKKKATHKRFPQWKAVNSTGAAESGRDAGEGAETERRYFISSLGAGEELSAHAARPHLGIENQLHYMLMWYTGRIPAVSGKITA
jgi:predicted transposase YbfD/YdcC